MGANDQQKRQILLFLSQTNTGIKKLKEVLKANFGSLDQQQKDIIHSIIKEMFSVRKNFSLKNWLNGMKNSKQN
jgi:ferritin-like metal-binding protein YciE